MTAPKMTANEVRAALLGHFQQRWAMIPEVTAPNDDGKRGKRRIDMLMVRQMPSRPSVIERLAVEIKVTRADFLNDIRNPDKQAAWRNLAHRHVYAVPENLVTPAEVPADSGLLYIRPADLRRGALHARVWFTKKCPKAVDPGPLPVLTVMDAFWRATRGESLRCGYGFRAADDADPEELRAQIARLKHELLLAQEQTETARMRVAEWRRRYARHEPPPCSTCGVLLRPASGGDFLAGKWQHVDTAAEEPCMKVRIAKQRAADQERGYKPSEWMYQNGYGVPGPEPDPDADPPPAAPRVKLVVPRAGR